MRLANKIGIVTAAGSGMGRSGAHRFAKEGACVAVVDRDHDAANAVAAEIGNANGRAIALVGDLTDDGFCAEIVEKTASEYGGLDFIWNHVGHPGPSAVEGIDMKDYELAMDLNMRSVLVTTVASIPHLRARGGGSLLYTSSVAGIQGSQFSPVYSAAKFAVVGFVRAMAKRYAKEGVRVNAICPGTVNTPMLRTFLARPDSQVSPDQDVEDLVRQRGGANPIGRAADPDEIASAALFFVSEDSSFVTGAVLPVDGGASA